VGQGKPANVQRRPSADFVAALPRGTSIHCRIVTGLFEARAVTQRNQRAFSYADVEPWINAEAPFGGNSRPVRRKGRRGGISRAT